MLILKPVNVREIPIAFFVAKEPASAAGMKRTNLSWLSTLYSFDHTHRAQLTSVDVPWFSTNLQMLEKFLGHLHQSCFSRELSNEATEWNYEIQRTLTKKIKNQYSELS